MEGKFVFEPLEFAIVIGAAIFATSLSELISYFLLYRRDTYRSNKSSSATSQPTSRSSTKNSRS